MPRDQGLRVSFTLSAIVLGLVLLSRAEAGSVFDLVDIGFAFLGGVTVGVALGAWILPALVDRLHRGR